MAIKKLAKPAGELRILLIKCSDIGLYKGRDWPKSPPLGLMYVSSSLKKWLKYPVVTKIVNVEISGAEGAEKDAFVKLLDEFAPDVVGMSAVTAEFLASTRVSKIVKEYNPNILTLLGGPHATVLPRSVMLDENLDYIVVGEGEKTVVELIHCLIEGGDVSAVKGISYNEGGRLALTPVREYVENLDELPFPDWDAIDFADYQKISTFTGFSSPDYKSMSMCTSRGCPFHCIFCHNIFGKKTRFRSAANVLEEMLTLRSKYGVRDFMIVDDIFNLDVKRTREILDAIIDEHKLDARIAFPNGMRGDMLTPELLDRFRAANTYYIAFAIETGSKRMQKIIKKQLDIEKVLANVQYASDIGIITCAFLMLGFPTETTEELLETLRVASMPQIDLPIIFLAIPQYGTELHEMAKNLGVFPANVSFDGYQYAISPINCSASPEKEFAEIKRMATKIVASATTNRKLLKKMEYWSLSYALPEGEPPHRGMTGQDDVLSGEAAKTGDINARLLGSIKKIIESGKTLKGYCVKDFSIDEEGIRLSLTDKSSKLSLKFIPSGRVAQSFYRLGNYDVIIAEKRHISEAEKTAAALWCELFKRLEERGQA